MTNQLSLNRDVSESGPRLILITLGIMAATLMQTLDSTIVNVALPTIQGNLGASQDEGAWVVTGYIISAVIVIPMTPWLQARFGRRQYYSVAIIGFTIASMLCGIATSIDQLIFYRVVQGLFGGGLVATGQASLRDTFPRHLLGASQAVFALGAIVGPSVGPTVGGWLTDNFSWNYVFFINLVPGIFAAFVILTMMRNPTDPKPIPIDGLGLALLAMGLGSLQYILDEGQRNDWFSDPLIRLFGATTALGLVAFVWWEIWGAKRPLVDLRAFKYRAIAAGSALGFAIGAVLFGATVILPQYVQGLLGFTATLSGELIFVRAFFIADLAERFQLAARPRDHGRHRSGADVRSALDRGAQRRAARSGPEGDRIPSALAPAGRFLLNRGVDHAAGAPQRVPSNDPGRSRLTGQPRAAAASAARSGRRAAHDVPNDPAAVERHGLCRLSIRARRADLHPAPARVRTAETAQKHDRSGPHPRRVSGFASRRIDYARYFFSR